MTRPMPDRASLVVLSALLAGGLAWLCPIGVGTAATIGRDQECRRLQQQLRHELVEHATAKRAAAARALQASGERLCASGKDAQGIRAYANALAMLGVKPVDE